MMARDGTGGILAWFRRLSRRALIGIVALVLVLLAARIALPFVLEWLVDERLARVEGYDGGVADIDVYLLRGAYAMNGVAVYRERGPVREPFFLASKVDFSLAWRELLGGKVVSEIYVDNAELSFAKQGVEPAAEPGGAGDGKEPQVSEDLGRNETEAWQRAIRDLFPISITHLEVRNSVVRYTDVTKAPHVDVFVKNLHATATGLRNRPNETGERFPARIYLKGDTLGEGAVGVNVALEPLAEHPHFHLTLLIEDVQLPALNESLRAIANVDVGRGTFHLTAEMSAEDGGFAGYVKPFFDNVDYTSAGDTEKPVLSRLWENIVAGLSWLVKNKARDEVATRIPFEGRFGNPDAGLLATIANLFRHGFVRAFDPTVEGSSTPEMVPERVQIPSADERKSGSGPNRR